MPRRKFVPTKEGVLEVPVEPSEEELTREIMRKELADVQTRLGVQNLGPDEEGKLLRRKNELEGYLGIRKEEELHTGVYL